MITNKWRCFSNAVIFAVAFLVMQRVVKRARNGTAPSGQAAGGVRYGACNHGHNIRG